MLRHQAQLQRFGDLALFVVQALVLIGERHGRVVAFEQPVGQRPERCRNDDACSGDDPPQVGEQITTEVPDRCHHEQHLLVAEAHDLLLQAPAQREIADTCAEQVRRTRFGSEIDRVVQLGKGSSTRLRTFGSALSVRSP